jgi:hypothetical protein
MNVRDIVVRGSEKVIGHYRLLLATARDHDARELLQSRIERERRFISETLVGDAHPTLNMSVSGSLSRQRSTPARDRWHPLCP